MTPAITEEQQLQRLNELWQRAWPRGVTRELRYPHGDGLMTAYLEAAAREHPDRTAVLFYGHRMTYRELDDLSSRFAGFLQREGVVSGDRVAVYLSNCPQFHVVFYGILKAGAIHVPINPMFKPAELRYELEDTEPKVIVTLEDLVPLLEQVRDPATSTAVVVTTLGEYLPEDPEIRLHPTLEGVASHPTPAEDVAGWNAYREAVAGSPAEPVEQDPDAIAALNYTGGTTGMPKGCMHTQRDMVYTAACSAVSLDGPSGHDVTLVFVPEFWIAGEDEALITPVFLGITCVLLNRWDPVGVIQAIERYRVTNMIAPADSYVEMLEEPTLATADLGAFHHPRTMSFVQKLTPELRQRWREVVGDHSVLRETSYGMTETHTMDTMILGFHEDDYDLRGRPVFCGVPFPGTEIKIVDFESGELLPLGEEGQILIRTPSLLKGYWNKPEATREQLPDGWLRTGDVGLIDEDGCLHYLSRRKEMLKVNGMSVFPTEIEVLLNQHPHIESCSVIGMPDPASGEVPVACVVPVPGAALSQDKLTAWCRANMATYKVPRIQVLEEFPMTTTGKVKKEELKRLVASHDDGPARS
jgi:long-chain acyl-CoA synthetase